MQPAMPTSPAPEISRHRLKQIAHWIRDELDLLVAREGPNILRPDDVLTLHELFVALRYATTITALDLRATGIHKAVRDIAGIATRWPGRLCDDCDKIITIWTSKFGRFDELHPFLYGRGGRLEGIANVTEYTREALLQRWAEHCPEKVHPRVSHRVGGLGFVAGDWWINPLFAHHAGIIGIESVEGGTTFDKKGAYALVLKDTGEMDAQAADFFTYRCPLSDKGKFRLTAATPSSREPIRVLRSHSINSIWGPKAGIRYEGLYTVKGWCVRQARPKDTISGEWKKGDILYEVTLRRTDSIHMDQVSKRPTNMEVDDYVEYKRLRKLHREHKRKEPKPLPMPQQTLKIGSPIPPLQLLASPTIAPQSLLRMSPSVSRKTTFKEPAFDAPKRALQESDESPAVDVVSPTTVRGLEESLLIPKKSGAHATHALDYKNKKSPVFSSDNPSPEKRIHILSHGASSLASSSQSGKSDLKDIIPWIDWEADLSLPSSIDAPQVVKEQIKQSIDRLEMNAVKNASIQSRDLREPSDFSTRSQSVGEKSTRAHALNLRLHSTTPTPGRKKERGGEVEKEREGRRVMFAKKQKLLDGTGYSTDEEDGAFDQPWPSRTRYIANGTQLHSPIPITPLQLDSLFGIDCGYMLNHGIEDIEFTSPLENLASRPRTATPVNHLMTPPKMAHGGSQGSRDRNAAIGKLKRMMSR